MAGKVEAGFALLDRAVRDVVALNGDVKRVDVHLASFESETRSRLSKLEDQIERRTSALEARMDRSLGDFDRRLRDIEQQLARLIGFMGQIEGKAAAYLVDRALEIQQARSLRPDGKAGPGGDG